ncbi:hypothetical protein LCGC14_0643630 [marine sediment metagenome]|uniref:HNH nuclease domain-containing protein n=1 Tax=marine sediment metagenome TaxID=412755 RepID=A0A0F9RI24_9ZZZZ
MAGKPTRRCRRTGCRGLVQDGTCAVCGTSGKVKEYRPGSRQRGYTKKWERYRRGFLGRNPLCVVCLTAGRTEPATVVDHIVPHRGDMVLFWKLSNHQALCTAHHNAKTGRGE